MRNDPEKLTDGYYYVRKSFEDTQSQLARYRVLGNAKTKVEANPGYFVFAEDGSCVYPEVEEGATETVNEALTDKAQEAVMPESYRLLFFMNVRTQPSLEAPAVEMLPEGTIVPVVGIEDDWLHLTDGNFIFYNGGKFAEKAEE